MNIYELARNSGANSKNPSIVWSFAAPLNRSELEKREREEAPRKHVELVSGVEVDPNYSLAHEDWKEGCEKMGAKVEEWTLISSLVTGMGGKGSFETGFTFLQPFGVPWLPGSGLKGLLRSAAADLWGVSHLLTPERYQPDMDMAALNKEFGKATEWEDLELWAHIFGSTDGAAALDCYGLRPAYAPAMFKQDVLTPHNGGYYKAKKTFSGWEGMVPPAGKDDPVPVSFLTVKPGLVFHSAVACTSDWLTNEIGAVLDHALTALGAGAKTTSGYGRFVKMTGDQAGSSLG